MTRKISDYMAEAFTEGKPRKRGDNQVRVTDEHVILSYYGYDIARRGLAQVPWHSQRLEVNLNGCAGGAGWQTATDRLRAIGVQMHSYNGEVFAEMSTIPGRFGAEFPVVQPVKDDGWSGLDNSSRGKGFGPSFLSRVGRLLNEVDWRYWRFRRHRGRTVISLENHESPVRVMGRWWDPNDPHILITVDAPELPAKERRFSLSSCRMFDEALLHRIEYAQSSPLQRVVLACKEASQAQGGEHDHASR